MRRAAKVLAIGFIGTLVTMAMAAGPVVVVQPTTIPSTEPGATTRTGEFEMVLRDRSPQSSQKELAKRFGVSLQAMGADYDLGHHRFTLRVPEDYSPDHPMGLVMYVNQNDAEYKVAPAIRPILDEKHLIFAQLEVPEKDIWKLGGLGLDLVFNLGKEYSLDKQRIYLISWRGGTLIGMGDADVFTGVSALWDYGWWDRIERGARSYWLPYQTKPTDYTLIPMAREHPFLLMPHPTVDIEYRMAVDKTMREDGYRYVKTRPLPVDDFHYPDVKPECFTEMIEYLDGVQEGKEKAATRESTPEAIKARHEAEAQSLVDLAKSYADAGRIDMARDKLNQVLDKYADTPAAVEAKTMLDGMNE